MELVTRLVLLHHAPLPLWGCRWSPTRAGWGLAHPLALAGLLRCLLEEKLIATPGSLFFIWAIIQWIILITQTFYLPVQLRQSELTDLFHFMELDITQNTMKINMQIRVFTYGCFFFFFFLTSEGI